MSQGQQELQRDDLPRLEWQTVHFTEAGSIRVEINRAQGRRGPLMSMRVARYDKGHPSTFFRVNDVDDAIEALAEAKAWVRANGR